MAVIQNDNLKDRIKGDTSNSINFTIKNNLGAAIDLTGASIKVQFRYRSKLGSIVRDMAIGTGITVATPTNGILTIDAFGPVTFAVDTYFYDVEITFSDGRIKTYVQGTFKVLQDTTHS
tara:strand:- start:4380 stop:4736 length:357 start_codon:yes stop_codon:yes gene_type:complete